MHARQRRHVRLATLLAALVAALLLFGGCDSPLNTSGGGSPSGPSGGLPTPTPGPSGPQTPTPTPTPSPTPAPDADTNGDTPNDPTPTPTPGVPNISCASNSDCDNLVYCDGVEQCVNTQCEAGSDPCPSQFEECDELLQTCVSTITGCLSDNDCEPGQNCDLNSGACIAPLAINCGPGRGVCNIANSTPGCENQDCCNDVCIQIPACCSFNWDDTCALRALTMSACLASPSSP